MSLKYIFRNGHCYCKLRLLSCGHFEAKTHLKPIQNEIVQWNQNFRFEIKIPENSNIDDAKLRISVRREGAKSEVKIGYVDVSENPKMTLTRNPNLTLIFSYNCLNLQKWVGHIRVSCGDMKRRNNVKIIQF